MISIEVGMGAEAQTHLVRNQYKFRGGPGSFLSRKHLLALYPEVRAGAARLYGIIGPWRRCSGAQRQPRYRLMWTSHVLQRPTHISRTLHNIWRVQFLFTVQSREQLKNLNVELNALFCLSSFNLHQPLRNAGIQRACVRRSSGSHVSGHDILESVHWQCARRLINEQSEE